jgi:cell division protein FtsB
MKKVMRLAGRLAVLAACFVVATVVVIQYGRIVARNVALSHALVSTRAEISVLRAKERKQKRLIERLSDPHGAIPEIHDRLHVVAPHEELIYLKLAPSRAPEPPPQP